MLRDCASDFLPLCFFPPTSLDPEDGFIVTHTLNYYFDISPVFMNKSSLQFFIISGSGFHADPSTGRKLWWQLQNVTWHHQHHLSLVAGCLHLRYETTWVCVYPQNGTLKREMMINQWISDWWFGTFFSIYWEFHHPN